MAITDIAYSEVVDIEPETEAPEPVMSRAGSFDHVVFWGLTMLAVTAIWTIWPAVFSPIARDMASARYLMDYWIEAPHSEFSPIVVDALMEPGRLGYMALAALAAASTPVIAVKVASTILIIAMILGVRALGVALSNSGWSMLILILGIGTVGVLEGWPAGFSLGFVLSILLISHWIYRGGDNDIVSIVIVMLSSLPLMLAHPPFWVLTFGVFCVLSLAEIPIGVIKTGLAAALKRFAGQLIGLVAALVPAVIVAWGYGQKYELKLADLSAVIPALEPGAPLSFPLMRGVPLGLASDLVMGIAILAAVAIGLALTVRLMERRLIHSDALLVAAGLLVLIAALPVVEFSIGQLTTRYRTAAGILGLVLGLAWAARGLEWRPPRYVLLAVATVLTAALFGLRINAFEQSRPWQASLIPISDLMSQEAPMLVLNFTQTGDAGHVVTKWAHSAISLNSKAVNLAERSYSLGALRRLTMQNPPARFRQGADPFKTIGSFDLDPGTANPQIYNSVSGLPLVWIVILGDPVLSHGPGGTALLNRIATRYESVYRSTGSRPLDLYLLKVPAE